MGTKIVAFPKDTVEPQSQAAYDASLPLEVMYGVRVRRELLVEFKRVAKSKDMKPADVIRKFMDQFIFKFGRK